MKRDTLPLVCLLALLGAVRAGAEEPLYLRDPTDLLVLNRANQSAELELLPDNTRELPDPLPQSGLLRVRLLDSPSNEVEIAYSAIARYERFPDRLLRVAKEHAGRGEFGLAYNHFARLDRDYADHPGLRAAFSSALRAEAGRKFQAGEQDHALALLGALAERDGRAPGLADAVDAIGDRIVSQRWEDKDYEGVRLAMRALEQQFSSVKLRVFDRWRQRLTEGAEAQLRKAQRLAAAGRSRQAIRAASGALALDPMSRESGKLLKRLMAKDRTLRVGVWQIAEPRDAVDIDTPAATRQARLLGGRVVTLDGYETTGGVYESAAGSLEIDGERRTATLSLRSPQQAAGLARWLLSRPREAREPLALLRVNAERVSYNAPSQVTVRLANSHPQPASLLLDALPPELAGLAPGEWKRVAVRAGQPADARFERVAGEGRFDVIEEYVYDDIESATEALRTQEIHLLDRAPAWRLSALSATMGIRLVPNRLPTIHCLLIANDSPIRARREVRRAIVYAIAREEILRTGIAGGRDRDGFAVLSAPVPLGVSLSDPLRYAYSDSVEPRPFDPRLAALLLTAARATDRARAEAAAAGEAGGDPPVGGSRPIPDKIRLAHTATPVTRLACEALRDQLGVVGLEVELVEADQGALSRGEVAYDLRYAEITLGEPLAEIWRLLGPGGVAGECSPPLLAALERVTRAPNGKQAAAELRDLHRVVFADLPLIPLWQTVEHTACQEVLVGLPASPIDLYHDLDRWDLQMKEAP